MKTKVLVYDDNEMLRSSIRFLVESEPGMELVTSLPNAQSVERDIVQYQPDVILMDIDMPLVNGVQAVARIRKIEEDLPVIMLTVFEDNENIFNAIYAGASGYILKRHLSEEIADAIRTVLNGGAPMTGSVAKKVLKMLPQAKSQEQEKSNLTEKETKILELLVNGFSYKMIASEIFISIDTVRFHIKKIYEKLHVHSATEAVSKALKNRLVE